MPRPDLSAKVKMVARLAVAGRLAAGQDAATIRKGAVDVAVKAIRKECKDEMKVEKYVAIVQRTVEEELAKV